MRKILVLTMLFAINYCASSQEKIPIAFIPIAYEESSVSSIEAKSIQESILSSFVSTKKFTVVDREKLQEIEKEKKLQRTQAFMDSQTSVKEGISKGASFLVASSIISVVSNKKSKNYETSLNIQIKILDVSTGEIIVTNNINSNYMPEDEEKKKIIKKYFSKNEIKEFESREEKLKEFKPSKEEAFIVALDRLNSNIDRFCNQNFPLSVSIVEFDAKKQNEFTLAAGSRIGLYKGQMLDIIKVVEVTLDGKSVPRKQKITTAWVINVDDSNFSRAVVVDDNKTYKEAKKAKAQFLVLTR